MVKLGLKIRLDSLDVINMGLLDFYKDLKKQSVNVIHFDWKPPAVTDEKLKKRLDEIL